MFDLAIIGGGINGCAIARDAVGRGLSVLLLEQGDLGSGTSSASTKLIHGGLRYLEQYAFRLVAESLREREILLRAAPHLVRPMRFVLPWGPGTRPWWMLRAGLFLYDRIGGRAMLPPASLVNLRTSQEGAALRDGLVRGLEYSDCWVDDARLVIATARDAARLGADIRPRTRCDAARPAEGAWSLHLGDGAEARARVLVNAAGPWVSRVLGNTLGLNHPAAVRMVKGSHIVTRRLFDHDKSYIFQNRDGRVCFAIPYERDFCLIGTTDQDYTSDPADVAISVDEENYLVTAVNAWLRRPIARSDIVWRYAGVRPLRDDGTTKAQEATRDYVLELTGAPPVLSVFGGKITTNRRLAEAAMHRLAPLFPSLPGPWTATAPLPGGDFPWDGMDTLRADVAARYPFIEPDHMRRLTRAYGTETFAMLGDACGIADMGRRFGAGLTARELSWSRNEEWARTANDVLWRRTKLGLRLTPSEASALRNYMDG